MKYLLCFSIFFFGCSKASDFCDKKLDPEYKILYSPISGKYVLKLDSQYVHPMIFISFSEMTKSPQYWRTESDKEEYYIHGDATDTETASQFSDSCELKRRYFKDQEMLHNARIEKRKKDSLANILKNSYK